ncbi:BACON domain-containing protein [Demequina litorisediminis]|uniref:BACON domain-containing protein n=1 Tax=Demequina litorisediminis TaxID=1849022 RepID=UPI0024E1906A|nr:BACON domain-containing carbohydrate-binding protein [Demequina litorisediminis]
MGDIYAFTTPAAGASQVLFYLDDPGMTGAPLQTENYSPFDFRGGTATAALPFDTTTLADGTHTLTARIALTAGGAEVSTATFAVANDVIGVVATPSSLSYSLRPADAPVTKTVDVTLTTGDNAGIAVEVSPDADWLTASAVDLTTPTTLQVTADPAGLAAGTYTASVTITTDGSDPLAIPVALTVTPASATYSLLYSTSPGRGAAAALDGASVVGDIYAFTSPTTGVTRVDFFVDDTDMSGGVYHSELIAPHDLEGGTTSAANPFDTTALPDGLHTLTALITTASGTEVAQATFSVENDAAVLSASPNPLTVNASSDDAPVVSNLVIGTGGAGTLPISVTTSGEDWLTASAPTGLSTGGVTVTLDPEGLATGTYTGSVTIEGGGAVLVVPVTLAVVDLSGTYSIQHSATASRANPTDLDGAQVAGDLFAFTSPTTNVTQVQFFLDDPAMSGAATHIENTAPHDFNGGTNSVAAPFDTTALPDGPHTITARIIANGVEEIAHAEFEVVNSAPTLAASPRRLALEAGEGEGAVATTFTVTASDGATPVLSITDTADWLTVTPASASAGGTLTATADPEGLLSGNYTAAITVAAAGYVNLTVEVGFEVEGAPAECYPLECSEPAGGPALWPGLLRKLWRHPRQERRGHGLHVRATHHPRPALPTGQHRARPGGR